MTAKNTILNKVGKKFLATILAIAMIISTIAIGSTNSLISAEETTKESGYVIENTTGQDITVIIKHMLNGNEFYLSDRKVLSGHGMINNYKKAVNYDVVSVVVDNKTLTNSTEWSNIKVDKDVTVTVNYRAITGESNNHKVAFYDYDVQPLYGTDQVGRVTKSINYYENYKNVDPNKGYFTVGQEIQNGRLVKNWEGKWEYNDNYDTNNVYTLGISSDGKSLNNRDTAITKPRGQYINRYAGLKNTSRNDLSTVTTGIIQGLDDEYNNVVFNFNEPGVFTNKEFTGKHVYNNGQYVLNFNQNGDTYSLKSVRNTINNNTTYTVAGAPSGQKSRWEKKFLPLDKPNGYTEQAEGATGQYADRGNYFFGMRYDVEFKLGDYNGPLNYKFTGDDDMWVLLDGRVVLDLGGVHSAANGEVNLRNELGSNPDRNTVHRLTVLYMERGGYDSNCEMEFTLPNARVIDTSEAPKTDITINKQASDNNAGLAGAVFKLTNDSNPNDTVTYATNAQGQVTFTNLVEGTYTLTEVSAPDGYQVTEGTYKIKVTDNGNGTVTAKLYKADGVTEITNNVIVNDPVTIGKDNIITDKTAHLTDWDERTYQIDLYAAHNIIPKNKAVNLAIMLDFSGSMPWFVTRPTGGTTKLSNIDTRENRNAYTTNTGGQEGVQAWNGYKYYVKRQGEGSSQEFKPIGYDSKNKQWRFIKSDEKAYKVFETNDGGLVTSNETIYIRGRNDQTKLEALQTAVTNFVDNLQTVSPNSNLAIIPFAGTVITDNSLTINKLMNVADINVDAIFNKITLRGGTNQAAAMNSAYDLLKGSNASDNYALLFSDGDYNKSWTNATECENANTKLKDVTEIMFTAGIFQDINSTGANSMRSWADDDPNNEGKKLVYIEDSANDLINAFQDIFGLITVQIKNATVIDYIDDRFILIDQDGNELQEGATINGGTVGKDANGFYVKWDNVNLSYAIDPQHGWHQTIYVKAKDEYIGGNDVQTNIGEISGVKLPGDDGLKEFDTPTVNVKIDLLIPDVQEVLFKGEAYTVADLPTSFPVTNKYSGQVVTENLTYELYEDKECTKLVTITNLTEIREDKTYYVKATYDVTNNPGTEESNANSTIGGTVYENTDVVAHDRDKVAEKYGILDIKFVAGQIEITKTINDQYTSEYTASKINSNQTFIFKIKQFAVNADGSKGGLVRTFYQTISFNANETETSKSALISELEKGYYEVTEETKWSTKYTLTDTKLEDGRENPTELYVGNLLEIKDGKKTFGGLDTTCKKYTSLANGENAKAKFDNTLKNWTNWYSDTGSAKNIFKK